MGEGSRAEAWAENGIVHQTQEKKILSVFEALGSDVNEQSFIEKFKQMYLEDWKLIQEKWEFEEQSTPLGKKHPMQRPNVYMQEMYRNHKNLSDKLEGKPQSNPR